MTSAVRIFLIAVVVAASAASLTAIRREPLRPDISVVLEEVEAETIARAALSVVDLTPLLERSPFDPKRGPFSRKVDAPPPARVVNVSLQGVFSIDGERRASLVIDGVAMTVTSGDDTPAGKVLEVQSDRVRLELNGSIREAKLFGD